MYKIIKVAFPKNTSGTPLICLIAVDSGRCPAGTGGSRWPRTNDSNSRERTAGEYDESRIYEVSNGVHGSTVGENTVYVCECPAGYRQATCARDKIMMILEQFECSSVESD